MIAEHASPTLIPLIHGTATLMMTGLIWFVQIVHYPLMASVGDAGFPAYEAAHTKRTTWVVGPLMLVELACALLLAFGPRAVGGPLPLIGLGCLGLIWGSTAFLQVPMHRILERGFDPRAHARLVATNWVRTVLWSARGVLGIVLLTGSPGA